MLKGFKDFLLRGNVLDLAVAVVVGTAFTAIVTAFTTYVINPLIAVLGGGDEIGLGFQLGNEGDESTFVNLGAVITASINFVIVAAVVYFVLIVPANAAKKRFATEPEDKEASETDLLIQIRDILELSSGRADTGAHAKATLE